MEDTYNHRLFINPFTYKFKDNVMLRSNATSASAIIEELLPIVLTVEGQTYRMSLNAVDFAFCLPAPIYKTETKDVLNRCHCVDCDLRIAGCNVKHEEWNWNCNNYDVQ